jgi:hypothetical protein
LTLYPGANPNPRKTLGFRDLGPVEIGALKQAVLAIPESVWDFENANKPNRYSSLDETRHIPLIFVEKPTDWRRSRDMRLWPQWKPLVAPVLDAATRTYGYARGAFPRVMLAQLPAGKKIHPHRDANLAAKWPHKIHVPLVTNDRVEFVIEGVGRHLAEGRAVEVNNMGVHSVSNDGNADRVHLIFEYYDLDQPEPDWIGAFPGQP